MERRALRGRAPVQPLASSPKPWRNMIVAGELEGSGAGMIIGGSSDMFWKMTPSFGRYLREVEGRQVLVPATGVILGLYTLLAPT